MPGMLSHSTLLKTSMPDTYCYTWYTWYILIHCYILLYFIDEAMAPWEGFLAPHPTLNQCGAGTWAKTCLALPCEHLPSAFWWGFGSSPAHTLCSSACCQILSTRYHWGRYWRCGNVIKNTPHLVGTKKKNQAHNSGFLRAGIGGHISV